MPAIFRWLHESRWSAAEDAGDERLRSEKWTRCLAPAGRLSNDYVPGSAFGWIYPNYSSPWRHLTMFNNEDYRCESMKAVNCAFESAPTLVAAS